MSKQQQFNVPALLIEQCGTGEDTIGIIGKKVRIPQDYPVNPLAAIFLGQTEPLVRAGAEGVVIHVDEDGVIYADFGDDERADVRETPDGNCRIYDIGNVDETNEDFLKLYELAE